MADRMRIPSTGGAAHQMRRDETAPDSPTAIPDPRPMPPDTACAAGEIPASPIVIWEGMRTRSEMVAVPAMVRVVAAIRALLILMAVSQLIRAVMAAAEIQALQTLTRVRILTPPGVAVARPPAAGKPIPDIPITTPRTGADMAMLFRSGILTLATACSRLAARKPIPLVVIRTPIRQIHPDADAVAALAGRRTMIMVIMATRPDKGAETASSDIARAEPIPTRARMLIRRVMGVAIGANGQGDTPMRIDAFVK